jgi:ankyrin repeat protein
MISNEENLEKNNFETFSLGQLLDNKEHMERNQESLLSAYEKSHFDSMMFSGCTDQEIKFLIETATDLNVQDQEGNTLLMKSVILNRPKITEHLLKKNVDLDVQNKLKQTALIIATNNDQIGNCQLLINKGANLNKQDAYGLDCLMIAIEKHSKQIKEYDQSTTRKLNEYKMLIELLLCRGANLNLKDNAGNSALFLASKDLLKENIQLIKTLIDFGADLNQRNAQGETPLLWAVKNINKQNHDEIKEMIELLILKGADLNVNCHCGSSPLMRALENDNTEMVELLINTGADLFEKSNANKQTPLEIALLTNQHDIVDILTIHLFDYLHQVFWNCDINQVKRIVIDSIDDSKLFLIKYDHIRALKHLDYQQILSDPLKHKVFYSFKYITSIDFRAKFVDGILNNLGEHEKFLNNIAEVKLNNLLNELRKDSYNQAFDLNNIEHDHSINLCYSQLKELVSDDLALLNYVNSEISHEKKILKAKQLLILVQIKNSTISKKLEVAKEFLNLLDVKCNTSFN